MAPAPSCSPSRITDLPEELLLRILLMLQDGESLVAGQRVCRLWRRLASSDALWQAVTLRRHSWLTQHRPEGRSWQEYFVQLTTCHGAAFVVLGGAYSAKGRQYSIRANEWSDAPPLSVERRGSTMLRDDNGYL